MEIHVPKLDKLLPHKLPHRYHPFESDKQEMTYVVFTCFSYDE